MLTIRLNRIGKRNKAQFRVVVQEHTIAPGGRHVEIVGSWDPHQKKGNFKSERIQYWIGNGAQVSDSVHNLLVKQGIIKAKKRAIKIKSAEINEAEAGKAGEAKATEKEEAVAEKTAEEKVSEKPKEEAKI